MTKPGEQKIRKNKYGNIELMVRCEQGWLVAGQFGDPGVYDEIEVWLEDDVGNVLQLAIVGRTEDKDEAGWRKLDPDWQPMHVYAYDGRDDDVAHEQYVKVDEHSNWY